MEKNCIGEITIKNNNKKEYLVNIYGGKKKKKKKEIMPLAATWMLLEILILSDVSQKEKDKYHIISLISGI